MLKYMSNNCLSLAWMKKSHLPSILEIETHNPNLFFVSDDFHRLFSNISVQGYIANYKKQMVGYLIYQFKRKEFEILSLNTHHDYDDEEISQLLLNHLKSRLKNRLKIYYRVRETHFNIQKILKSNGFQAKLVLNNFFKNYYQEFENAYHFEWLNNSPN